MLGRIARRFERLDIYHLDTLKSGLGAEEAANARSEVRRLAPFRHPEPIEEPLSALILPFLA